MRAAGFDMLPQPKGQPGIWTASVTIEGEPQIVPIDLIVPDAFAPPGGRRSARIAPHGAHAARKAEGLEAALVDHAPMAISALDASDTRSITVEVAGLAAMLVAKAYKIRDRLADNNVDRLSDKDAADVYRIMQTASPREPRRDAPRPPWTSHRSLGRSRRPPSRSCARYSGPGAVRPLAWRNGPSHWPSTLTRS